MATYWENSCSFGLRCFHGVNLVFSHLGFSSGNLFLIAPFPDRCLLVPFCVDYPLKSTKFTVIPFGSMLPNLKGH